jgi:hypothetical protein
MSYLSVMLDTAKILLITCVSSVLLLTSCDLTEYNPSGLTDESVYTQPEGFESLVNASYSYARWWYGKEEGYAFSVAGTDTWISGSGDENVPLSTYEDLDSEVDIINGGGVDDLTGMWKHMYTAINLVNTGIEGVGDSGLSESLQTTREAELRYLRAFFYWHIVDQWGGVHLTTDPTQGVQTTANRTSVDQFYQQIFTDLEFAVNNLPTTPEDPGRATRPAAEAFMARMHVARGNNQDAIDMADRVIDQYNFELLDDYDALWDMDNLQNSEVVWSVNYTRDLTLNDQADELRYPQGHPRGGFNGHLFFLPTYDDFSGVDRSIEYGRPFNRYMPSRFLLDLYDRENSTRYDDTFREVWYSNQENPPQGISPGDTALYATSRDLPDGFGDDKPYIVFDRDQIYNPDGSPIRRDIYPALTKFVDPTRPSIQLQVSSRDVFVFRLAEMYLIAAEAYLNMGSPGQAVPYINEIRRRAARPGQEAEMEVTASEVDREFLLDEWAREFAGEQLRWTILKRNDALVSRTRAHHPDASPHIQDFHRLRPIPQSQIDAVENDDVFTQNPGYSGR